MFLSSGFGLSVGENETSVHVTLNVGKLWQSFLHYFLTSFLIFVYSWMWKLYQTRPAAVMAQMFIQQRTVDAPWLSDCEARVLLKENMCVSCINKALEKMMRRLQAPSRTLFWNLLVFTFCFGLRVCGRLCTFPSSGNMSGHDLKPRPSLAACPLSTVCCPARDDITATVFLAAFALPASAYWIKMRGRREMSLAPEPRRGRGKLISHFKEAPRGRLTISVGCWLCVCVRVCVCVSICL